jgi:hypothetical protein
MDSDLIWTPSESFYSSRSRCRRSYVRFVARTKVGHKLQKYATTLSANQSFGEEQRVNALASPCQWRLRISGKAVVVCPFIITRHQWYQSVWYPGSAGQDIRIFSRSRFVNSPPLYQVTIRWCHTAYSYPDTLWYILILSSQIRVSFCDTSAEHSHPVAKFKLRGI